MITYGDDLQRQALNDAANMLGGWANILGEIPNMDAFLRMVRQMRVGRALV